MTAPAPIEDAALRAALAEQHRLGVLGTTVDEAIAHSERYLAWLEPGGTVLDLGSGAGVPGLVIAVHRPDLRMILLDVRERRTDQLRRLVHRLDLHDRVTVVTGPAERIGRSAPYARTIDAVVARSFGTPMEVLRGATGFLRVGGRLVVSEPPGPTAAEDRWTAPLESTPFRRVSPPRSPVFAAERFT